MESKHVLVISGGVCAFLFIAAVFVESFVLRSNLAILAIAVLLIPYFLNKFFEFKRIRDFEDEFPNFLRDLAESQRAGLTMMQSIQSASKSQYGMLTSEIARMYNQLSWNVPVEIVFRNFAIRMRKSKTIVRAVMIIDQATKSGGNVAETMNSLATNIEGLKEVQEEKSTMLNQQVLMMYAIFFIFLGITVVLIKFLVPLLQTQAEAGGMGFQGFSSNPCLQCVDSQDSTCLGCTAFYAVSGAFQLGEGKDASAYYKGLFFTMILVQGLFCGLISGQIGSDSVTGGVKHSLIMVLAGFLIFIVSVRIGFI